MASQTLVTWLCFAVLSLIGLSLQQEANLRLEVEPHYIEVDAEKPVTVTCTLSDAAGGRVPLAGCGFRDYRSGVAWDIDTGSATINNTIRGEETSALITSNTDNAVGVCRITLNGLPREIHILGCRVRPVTGAWRYAAMMVFVNIERPHQYRLQPPRVLVSLPGSDVAISGLAERQVDYCFFYLPPDNTWIYLLSHETFKNTTQYRAWREDRRCAVTLLAVKASLTGFVWSVVGSFSPGRRSGDFVELIVATPPVFPPQLSVFTTDAPFQAGDMLHATCVVEGSRPVSNITWLLGGEVVRQDDLNETPVESIWRWNHDPQPIMQRVSRRLTQQDDGKLLICRAGHLALPSGALDSKTYTIRVEDHLDAEDCAGAILPPAGVSEATKKNPSCLENVSAHSSPLKPSSILCEEHALRVENMRNEMKYLDEIHLLRLKEAEILVEVATQRKREATAAADIAELELSSLRQKH